MLASTVSLAHIENASFPPLGSRKHNRNDGSSLALDDTDACASFFSVSFNGAVFFAASTTDGSFLRLSFNSDTGLARLFASSSSILDLLPIIELLVLLLTVAETADSLLDPEARNFLFLAPESFENEAIVSWKCAN